MIPIRYDEPIEESVWWDDDGTPEFQAMWARLERERMVLEKA